MESYLLWGILTLFISCREVVKQELFVTHILQKRRLWSGEVELTQGGAAEPRLEITHWGSGPFSQCPFPVCISPASHSLSHAGILPAWAPAIDGVNTGRIKIIWRSYDLQADLHISTATVVWHSNIAPLSVKLSSPGGKENTGHLCIHCTLVELASWWVRESNFCIFKSPELYLVDH